MAKKLGLLAVLLALAMTATAAFGSEIAWDFTTTGSTGTNGNWTLGEVFTPTQNITLDYLGYYDNGCPACFTSDHPVGIFDANGDLLASTTITASSSVTLGSANFVFNPVSPITLLAGQTYVLEGVSNTDNYTWNEDGFTVYAPINIDGENYVQDAGLTFNGTWLAGDPISDGYWGANFGAAVPEPSALLLLATGLLGLGGAVRRKLRA